MTLFIFEKKKQKELLTLKQVSKQSFLHINAAMKPLAKKVEERKQQTTAIKLCIFVEKQVSMM